MSPKNNLTIGGVRIAPGETKDVRLKVSESYFGHAEFVPVRVIRATEEGPTLFLTGAVHGDELTGVGIIREIMMGKIGLQKGTLICVPVVNIFGFENHSRYMPDRRDLNRSFPGSGSGTMTSRLTNVIFEEVIKKSDFGIDCHAAAKRRTNFPQIRVDKNVKGAYDIAKAFGCELIINGQGPDDSLRYNACVSGCPTIVYEAGEALKFESGIVRLGVRGVYNILKKLGMIKGKIIKPVYQTLIDKTAWERSNQGGLLKFYVKPGDLVAKGKKIATCHNLFSKEYETIRASVEGFIIGMTTLPAVKPGEPVCHIGKPDLSVKEIKDILKNKDKTLHRVIHKELATSFSLEDEEQASKII